jgi:glycosyltransferase involved in cell wall biosynthesis
VVDTLSQHDLFFLPTLGENYGHVIVEALQAGLPILISDQTPWRDLKDRGIGLDLALTDTLGFARFIDDLAGANQAQWSALRSCIAKEASILADLSQPIEDNRALFFEP